MKYQYCYEKTRKHRNKNRMQALLKLAQGKPPVCAICGCPHIEILHIGHPMHDGSYHKRTIGNRAKGVNSRDMVDWVRKTDLAEVLTKVQLECPYCNAWHNRFGDYPSPDKRPKW